MKPFLIINDLKEIDYIIYKKKLNNYSKEYMVQSIDY
jgi:hypothetical protein